MFNTKPNICETFKKKKKIWLNLVASKSLCILNFGQLCSCALKRISVTGIVFAFCSFKCDHQHMFPSINLSASCLIYCCTGAAFEKYWIRSSSGCCFVKMLQNCFKLTVTIVTANITCYLPWHFTDDWVAKFIQPCCCTTLVSDNGGIRQCRRSCNPFRPFQFRVSVHVCWMYTVI